MKTIALIPARYQASRFPGKLLAMLKGKTVIRRTYESAVSTGLFSEVIVVTDSDKIKDEIESIGGKVVMSIAKHESGTDRIAEAIMDIEADVFVNVQGDEPFVQKDPIEKLLKVFEGPLGKNVQVGSIVQKIKDEKYIVDTNYVKVVLDLRMHAMYFSRSPIPFVRDTNIAINFYEHIGVYAFRKKALIDFTLWPPSPLERVEKIECLRFIENGVPIKMVITPYMGVQIDIPTDIAKAEAFMEEGGLV